MPWYYHDWSQYGNQAPQNVPGRDRSPASDRRATLDDFARKAQFVNYENTRAMFEAWNANLWDDASGLMLWMSHPAWHSTVWQTYDYDFDVNGTYYGARKACEPVHVQADPVHWQVIAVNHTPHAVSGATVSARLYDLSGRQLGTTQSAAINVAAADSAKAFAVAWTDALPDLHLLRLTLQDASGKTLSENTYWRYRAPSAMQALNKAQQTRITASITGATSGGDGRRRADGDGSQPGLQCRGDGAAVAAEPRFGGAGPAHSLRRELRVAAPRRDAHDHRVVPGRRVAHRAAGAARRGLQHERSHRSRIAERE